MSSSRHSRRHSLPHIPSFHLGEDIDLAIGLTAGALAGNEFLESSESHSSRASHLLKAGLSAVIAAGAFKMLGREHRENAQQHSRHHHANHRTEDDGDARHSNNRHRLHHHEDEWGLRGRTCQREAHHGKRIDDEDEHRHGHSHPRHHHHHQHHHYDDEDDSAAIQSCRGHHRHHLRAADDDRPHRRHSFESGSSRPADPERSHPRRAYGYRDRDYDVRNDSMGFRDAPTAYGKSSSTQRLGRSGAGDQQHTAPASHHVHFSPTEADKKAHVY
ncbi:hypothetical protein N0V93_009670 [Gnomoniopsis smithogilvyi]|uniref:Uncharacterized protein n=1 Tax=Gnomoniopsis smithogilvyi TaxID=1191159 RepID=A0A9W9CTW7_9PEZI|nr:hypothetical protein N0V93_009670 [Gnomoniopsis smithogilvyi]